MKRLKFTLKFFGGCLLVLVVLFIYVINWGSKRALDYKIDDISMERVDGSRDGSLIHIHINHDLFRGRDFLCDGEKPLFAISEFTIFSSHLRASLYLSALREILA